MFQNTSIVIQVSSDTRRDQSPTLSQDSRPWNGVQQPKTKVPAERSKCWAQECKVTILWGLLAHSSPL